MEINVQETVLKFSYNPKYMALSGRAPLIQKTRLILVVDLKSNIFEELSSRKSKSNLKSKKFDVTFSMNKLSTTDRQNDKKLFKIYSIAKQIFIVIVKFKRLGTLNMFFL